MYNYKKKNRKRITDSSYYNNNSRKSFDHTMNRLYGLIENQENKNINTEFFAKIISGHETGDTSYFGLSIFNSDFYKQNDVIPYNIRFLEPYEQYNLGLADPMLAENESERSILTQNHPEAFFFKDSFFSSLPVVGARVLVTDRNNDGIYRIERLLDESEGPAEDSNVIITDSSPSSAFFDPKGPLGFIDGLIQSAITSLDEPEVKFTGKRKYSKTKSVYMEGKTYRPYIRKYVGQRQKYKNTDIENGVRISDFHVKVVGFTRGHNPTFIPDIVDSFKKLCEAYEAQFGEKIKLSDSFRTWKGQINTRKKYGQPSMLLKYGQNLAALPGSSNHGWGLAFDWDTEDSKGNSGFRSETYKWMFQNAPKFGFHNPPWAQETGSKPEAWHFEWKFPGKIFI